MKLQGHSQHSCYITSRKITRKKSQKVQIFPDWLPLKGVLFIEESNFKHKFDQFQALHELCTSVVESPFSAQIVSKLCFTFDSSRYS